MLPQVIRRRVVADRGGFMLRSGTLPTVITIAAVVCLALPAGARAQGDGAKVYAAQKCSICHSIAGQGNKKLPLDDVGKKLTADQIREWIVAPAEAAKKAKSTAKPPMKAYASLPKADLDALVTYLASLTGK
jgi:mono/diheme cytochrome c family protein